MAKGNRGGKSSSSGKAGGRARGKVSSETGMNSPLVKGLPQGERKDFYYHVNNATSKEVLSGKEVMVHSDAVKYENILVNVDYPEISGTEKQVNYAKNLLHKAIVNDIDRLSKAVELGVTPERRTSQKQKIDNLISQTNKAFGTKAETLSDVVNESIRRKGALKFARDNPTARAIIDKFG